MPWTGAPTDSVSPAGVKTRPSDSGDTRTDILLPNSSPTLPAANSFTEAKYSRTAPNMLTGNRWPWASLTVSPGG